MRFLLRKNRKPPTVIIVALIDVLMVVLIFMVVSTTFTNQAAVKLVLPESSQAKAAPAVNDSLIVTVAKEPPHFFFGTNEAAAADLEAELKQRIQSIADNPELELSIRADTGAPWGKIIKLMDAGQGGGRHVRESAHRGIERANERRLSSRHPATRQPAPLVCQRLAATRQPRRGSGRLGQGVGRATGNTVMYCSSSGTSTPATRTGNAAWRSAA